MLAIAGAIAFYAVLILTIDIVYLPPRHMANTIVKVTPSKTILAPGEKFTVEISIEPAAGVTVYGAQFNLAFNAGGLKVDSLTEGNFMKQGGATSYFQPGTISTSEVKNVAGAITTPGQSVNAPGVFAILNCTALTAGQASSFVLSDVIVATYDGVNAIPLPLESPIITQIVVVSSWDLNFDGKVDLADMVMISMAWGATSGREDVNTDGVVNVLDLIVEGQHFFI